MSRGVLLEMSRIESAEKGVLLSAPAAFVSAAARADQAQSLPSLPN